MCVVIAVVVKEWHALRQGSSPEAETDDFLEKESVISTRRKTVNSWNT